MQNLHKIEAVFSNVQYSIFLQIEIKHKFYEGNIFNQAEYPSTSS